VVFTIVLGSLALLSLLLLLWQWAVALRFPLHKRLSKEGFHPGVTFLKPLKGADAFTEGCLRSWFKQDYCGQVQILFGVATADDPVCDIVKKLISEHPRIDAQFIICGPLEGANAKVSKLIQLEKLAKYDLLVISDADVRVPSDLLQNLLVPFSPRDTPALQSRNDSENLQPATCNLQLPVGLVNCFYTLANPSTLAMHWEAIAINADFWSQVLQAQSLKPLDFALGAVMSTTRAQLQGIGGFAAIKNCLADDYQLGHRIAKAGGQIVLCSVPVECFSGPMGWRAVWKHQLRWARTIRVSQPLPYFFSILSNATLWPLLWLVFARTPLAVSFALVAASLRVLMGGTLQCRLTGKSGGWRYLWLIPVKDLLQTAIWAAAFMGNSIEWRGERLKLLPNGDMARV
jgi:ceramide glucosyltransferase